MSTKLWGNSLQTNDGTRDIGSVFGSNITIAFGNLSQKNDGKEDISDYGYLQDVKNRLLINYSDKVNIQVTRLMEGYRFKFKICGDVNIGFFYSIGIFPYNLVKEEECYVLYIPKARDIWRRFISIKYVSYRFSPALYMLFRFLFFFLIISLCLYVEFINKPQKYESFQNYWFIPSVQIRRWLP